MLWDRVPLRSIDDGRRFPGMEGLSCEIFLFLSVSLPSVLSQCLALSVDCSGDGSCMPQRLHETRRRTAGAKPPLLHFFLKIRSVTKTDSEQQTRENKAVSHHNVADGPLDATVSHQQPPIWAALIRGADGNPLQVVLSRHRHLRPRSMQCVFSIQMGGPHSIGNPREHPTVAWYTLELQPTRNAAVFWSFPSVCPELVLANDC